MNRLLIAIFSLLIFASSCKSSKVLSSASAGKMSSKQLQKYMDDAAFKFNFLQAKARVKYIDDSMNQSFTANIRIENNQNIWMSLTGPFGIEGARVLISKNRIQIIDRLNGKYYDEPFDFINNYLPFKADFAFIQNLLIGNAFQNNWTKQKIAYENDKYLVNDQFDGIAAQYEVNNSFRYHKVILDETAKQRNIELDFENYSFVEEQLFAMLRKIAFNDAGEIKKVELDFNKVKKEQSLDFPFEVPDRLKN